MITICCTVLSKEFKDNNCDFKFGKPLYDLTKPLNEQSPTFINKKETKVV